MLRTLTPTLTKSTQRPLNGALSALKRGLTSNTTNYPTQTTTRSYISTKTPSFSSTTRILHQKQPFSTPKQNRYFSSQQPPQEPPQTTLPETKLPPVDPYATTMNDPAAYRVPTNHIDQYLDEILTNGYPKEPNPDFWRKLIPPGDEEKLRQELRWGGSIKALETLVQIDTAILAPVSQNIDKSTMKGRVQASVLEKLIEARASAVSKLTFHKFDPIKGVGVTPKEQRALVTESYIRSRPEVYAEEQQLRHEYYAEGKKKGLYKKSFFNSIFNSKEDMLLARPASNVFDGSEHSAAQPRSWLSFAAMSACCIAGFVYLKWQDTHSIATATVVQYQTNGTLNLGGDFDDLVDHLGQPASTKQYRGFYPLYYFGFTKCPDICPTELHKMMAALDIIETKQPELYRYIKPIFVTVDPLRDTEAQIAAYAENFHPRMRWLTGSHQALTKAAKEFHIYFSIPDDATPDGDYNVDHSIFFFLMDREGKLLSYYGQNKNAVEIAEAMASVVQEDLERDKLESALNARKM
jgi:protein SCO1/2